MSNDKKYEGFWVSGRMQGQGVYTWPDGKIYEGKYLEDQKHGFGIFKW